MLACYLCLWYRYIYVVLRNIYMYKIKVFLIYPLHLFKWILLSLHNNTYMYLYIDHSVFYFFFKLLSLRKWNLSDEIRKIPSPVKIIKELLSHANMFLKIVHYNFICIKMKMKRNAVESKLVQSWCKDIFNTVRPTCTDL